MQKKYPYLLCFFFLLTHVCTYAQQRFTLSGNVRDAGTGETLIGATVKIQNSADRFGTAANEYGFYSLTGKEGDYELTVSYAGYQSFTRQMSLHASTKLNIQLSAGNALQEVVVKAGQRKNENVRSPQMGLDKLNMKDLDNVPVLFGEKDVLKTIQMLPGVKSGGEGNTGFLCVAVLPIRT